MTESELQKACRVGDCSKIREILTLSPYLLNELDHNLGWPPLYRTVTCGHIDASKELLRHGANPNVKNKLGDSPLHQAVESNQILLVQVLLDHGADTNIPQNDGNTPLHYSCLKEFLQITNLLLKYRANPNLQEKVFGRTALHIAAESKNLHIVQLLVKYSARNDIEDFSGNTPADLWADIKNLIGSGTEKEIDSLSKQTPSFDHSEISVKADSIIEPEGEHLQIASAETFSNFSFGSDPHHNSLYKWLTSMKLECLFPILHSNGYDDLDFLIAQIKSSEPLTLQLLEEIGVSKAGHRLKLLVLLEEEAFKDMRQSIPVRSNFMCVSPKQNNFMPLEYWLDSIQLKKLFPNFVKNGFEDTETLFMIMQTNYALNEETLKTYLGIEKLGHRQRILNKIKEEIGTAIRHKRVISRMSIEKDEPITACEFCVIL